MKLFHKFHKPHQEPSHALLANSSSKYFQDTDSNLIPIIEKSLEQRKKEKKKLQTLKTIKEINRLSPDNNKKLKIREKKTKAIPKNFKKIENFEKKSPPNPDIFEDDKLFIFRTPGKHISIKKDVETFLYEDTSLSRLRFLGLESILKEIKDLEEKKKKSILKVQML